MSSKILGLDLGVSSIGWAIIELDKNASENKILGLGSRVIPLSNDEKDQFVKGNAQTKNRDRTQKRTARKTNFRYKLRREYLSKVLKEKNMLPESDLFHLTSLHLYSIRAKAATKKISLKELGRIFLHLNQKRGYKSSRKEKVDDQKNESAYLLSIKEREGKLNGRTIGQYFYDQLKEKENFEIKKNIFYRDTYIAEFDAIWDQQRIHYPEILNTELKEKLKNEIIYFQRPLKSQKHLIGGCQFEKRSFKKNGKFILQPIKVTPLSSPLFQTCKIWQTINNIEIKSIYDKTVLYLEPEQRRLLFDYISGREKTSWIDILRLIDISKDEYRTNIRKDVTGNVTRIAIKKKLEEAKIDKEKILELLKYDPLLEGKENEAQPYYKLWHILYSIEQPNEAINALIKNFAFGYEQASIIITTSFKDGFASLCSKALRKILPHLQDGKQYDKACMAVGYNHSSSITKEENENRPLVPFKELKNIQRGELRNPAVERILNQVINVVKDICEKFGVPDEIRIELARELKQNAEERNRTFKLNNEREKERKWIIDELSKHPYFTGKRISNRDIEKYKLWKEFDRQSPYRPNHVIGLEELFSRNYEIEHVIPRTLFFDDSFANKCIAHVTDNREKNNDTAYDFMKVKRASLFEQYCKFIQDYYKRKDGISKTKFERLMTAKQDIPQDFIDRQLRLTQYITKEAKNLLSTICRNVWVTSGSVTNYVRHLWGYDNIIHDLNFESYKEHGLTEYITIKEDHQDKTIERIKNWNKRLDHRHHAVDALVIACTTQGMIHQINTLSSQKTRNEIIKALQGENQFEEKRLLDKYIKKNQPFPVSEVADKTAGILISFKAGKRVASISKNKIGKYRIGPKQWIPRAPLHEETVYGKIKKLIKIDIKKLTPKNIDFIADKRKKEAILSHLEKYKYNYKNALSTKALLELEFPNGTSDQIEIYKDEFVVKYNLNDAFKEKDCDFIIDNRIKKIVKQRLRQFNGNPKEAFKELDKNPIWVDETRGLFVKSVTCKTGLSDLWFARRGYVKPGNNHDIAVYKNETGQSFAICTTFWEAFERKKQGISIIATTHSEFGKLKFSIQQNEMFVFDLSDEELSRAISINDKKTISDKLYRVQKLSIKSNGQIDLWFRKHLETLLDDTTESKNMKRFINIQSVGKLNCIKVKVDRLGNIFPVNKTFYDKTGKQDNLSEPETMYKKEIKTFKSFEEANEEDAKRMAALSPTKHLQNVTSLIKKIFDEELKRPMDKKIKFK